MFIRVGRARPRALRVGVATGAGFLAICGFAAEQTFAGEPTSVKARVDNGTLQITGTPGADKLVLRLDPGNPNELDVGYLITGRDLVEQPELHWNDDREPLALETSMPGVFAAGDVREGSIKRVASGVGEGATVVRLVHEHLRAHEPQPTAR